MILFKKLSRFLITIKHLKYIQIYYRLYFHIYRPLFLSISNLQLNKIDWKIKFPNNKYSKFNNDLEFDFMNLKHSIKKDGWDNKDMPLLWRYNLHYFDDLNSHNIKNNTRLYNYLLDDWIENNTDRSSIAWNSYSTSLRIINIIKWAINGNKINKNIIISLKTQIIWLSKRIEWHLLGNHLFTNAKALLLGSLFFLEKDEIIFKKSIRIINDQIKEQVLNDGAHFELSTMYHSIFLEDILDIINISHQFPEKFKKHDINLWKETASKMMFWLKNFTHSDGDIAFFNDSAFSIASKTDDLYKYMASLNINDIVNKQSEIKLNSFEDSGYISIKSNNIDLFIDVAKIGPDYLPAHAHADTLSFELSYQNYRVFVNSGTSSYENQSQKRNAQRSTAFHNTLSIDNQNSSDVWASFRVGRRAKPKNLEICEDEGSINISCSHDGYSYLKFKPIHTRKWRFENNILSISDHVSSNFYDCHANYILHPDIMIDDVSSDRLKIILPNDTILSLIFIGAKIEVIDHAYAHKFGDEIKTKSIKVINAHNYTCKILNLYP